MPTLHCSSDRRQDTTCIGNCSTRTASELSVLFGILTHEKIWHKTFDEPAVNKGWLTGYTWVHASKFVDSEAVTNASSKWITAFYCMLWIVSDQGDHFTAAVVQKLTKELPCTIIPELLTANWPMILLNVLSKEVLRAYKTLRLERKLGRTQWPLVLGFIQFIGNQFHLESLRINDKIELRTELEDSSCIKPTPSLIRWKPIIQFHIREALERENANALINVWTVACRVRKNHKKVTDRNLAKASTYSYCITIAKMSYQSPSQMVNVSWFTPRRICSMK